MWDRCYFVYIIANATRILYTGITNNLVRRVWEHKTKQTDGFTSHFHLCRLVYYESFDDVRKAINREKQIKRWRREKKIWLIERVNRNWKDLSDGWYEDNGIAPRLALKRSLGVTDRNG
ncbi:MAG: GIY-YIG nuclease family protein [Terriglobales bacterium]